MNKISGIILGFIVCVVVGCKDTATSFVEHADGIKSNNSTWVVTVGMENSKFAGACPGAGLDAARMTRVLTPYAGHIASFSNETATRKAVCDAMIEAAENAELFIFYYSGHGGQNKFWSADSSEEDGMDEYLCLYDTYLLDDQVWQIFSRCKGRVMMINDCCHSQTIFRDPAPITMRGALPFGATHYENGSVNLLVWSGCPDDTYSYGSSTGGKFTNTLLKYLDPRKTYDVLWTEIENDSSLKQYETVQRTIIGGGFTAKPVFQ